MAAVTSRAHAEVPTIPQLGAALASSFLLILSFPDFGVSALAWFGLTPLLVTVARRPTPFRAFLLGLVTGTVFFYVSCYWLTYSLIHYGELAPWLAYLLLAPAALIVGIFPALFALFLARAIKRWGTQAILLSPFIWTSLEWARLGLTGQLWNAIGYSQAYHPLSIQPARWGGVYLEGFLVVAVNAAISLALLKRTRRGLVTSVAVIVIVMALHAVSWVSSLRRTASDGKPYLHVVALQPNVPMTPAKTAEELEQLTERHLSLSTTAVRSLPNDNLPRLVIWPESPMNFTYSTDSSFQTVVTRFAKENHTYLLLNSQEPAPEHGSYNSALLINEEGRLISQYDKIRLMPFGEYVPLPRWLPGASLITAMVGEFTPGEHYTLMPIGTHRAGVFICVESAYPSIPRKFTDEGADLLINISNDGYLGPTAVMRQHLANMIFRAVENDRPLISVTNTGITAFITTAGEVKDPTPGFESVVRTWTISSTGSTNSLYVRHGDLFAGFCAAVTLIVFVCTLRMLRRDF